MGAFEERKLKFRKRIKRQQRALRQMKQKQRERFPAEEIYNSDSPAWNIMQELDPQPQNGREMLLARGPIAAGASAVARARAGQDPGAPPAACRAREQATHEAGVNVANLA
ncbi:hypothetical protein BGX38DRAFT_1147418 [Terfezia claveryi]|nr:hypothetical protein BGX38DRAFT_1147418 [Terfezia claveryi]